MAFLHILCYKLELSVSKSTTLILSNTKTLNKV